MKKLFYSDSILVKAILTLLVVLLLYSQLPIESANSAQTQCTKSFHLDDFDPDDIHINVSLGTSLKSYYFLNFFDSSSQSCHDLIIPSQRGPPVFSLS